MTKLSTSVFALATIFSIGGALAADIDLKRNDRTPGDAYLSDPKPSENWSGPYVGVHVGWAWGDASTSDDLDDWCAKTDKACIAKYVGPFDYSPDGVLAGATAGYNHQIGQLVIGVEGELGYMNLAGEHEISSSANGKHQDLTFDDGLYGVLAARVGVSFGRALVYAKGGWAYFDGASSQKTTNPGFVTNETDAFTGWAYGGGVEYMLNANWSLKAEYLRFDFGDESGDQTAKVGGHVFEYDTELTVDTAKVGLNYRF